MLDQQLLIGTVFLAGLASFLSPCIFPIIPIYFGILSKGGKKVLNTFLFILGLSLTFVSLGFSFGFLGNILFSNTTRIIAGVIVIILGIHQLGIFNGVFLIRLYLSRAFILAHGYSSTGIYHQYSRHNLFLFSYFIFSNSIIFFAYFIGILFNMSHFIPRIFHLIFSNLKSICSKCQPVLECM